MESASQGPGRYHPIFSRALEGSVVCIDGFKPVVRDNMSTLTRLMNSKHAPVLNSEVTHLIAETVRCDSYQTAAALGIKILRPQWLFDRWSKVGEVLYERDYVLECFAGLTLCVTGVEVEKRNEIKSLTMAHGGEFSAALDRSCTHLLAETASSLKVQFAVTKLNIPILHTDWFLKSIEKGYALPEEKFVIQAAKNPLALPAPSQLRQSQMTVQSYFSADNSKELMTPPASSTVSSINVLASSLMPATPRDLVQKYKNATPACSQVTQHTATKSVVASQPVIIKAVTESEKRPLVECSLYLCGFVDEESELFQNMVLRMGGKCIDLAVDHISNVTHVVIGDSSKSQLRTISRLLTMRTKPLVVTKQWVEECYKIQARLSEITYVFNIAEHLDTGPIDLSTDHMPPKNVEPVSIPRTVSSQTSNASVPSQTQGNSRTTATSTPHKNPLSYSGQILMGPPKNKFVTAASDFKTVINNKSGKAKADSLVETAQTMRRVLAAPVGLEPLADSVEQNTGSENTGDDMRQFKSKKTPAKKKSVSSTKTKPRVSSSSSESLSDEFMFQPPRTNRTFAESAFVPGALMLFEPDKARTTVAKHKSPIKKLQVRSKMPVIEPAKGSDDKKRPRPIEHKLKQASPTKKKKIDRSAPIVRPLSLERKDSEPISLDIEWMITSQRLNNNNTNNSSELSQALFHSQIRSQTKEPSQRSYSVVESVDEYREQDLYAEEQMEYQEDMYNEQELPVEDEYDNEIPVAADLQEPEVHEQQEGAFFPTPYDAKHNDLNKSLTIDVNNPTSVQPNALQFEEGEKQVAEDEEMDDNEYEEELIGESSPRPMQQHHDDQSDAEKTHSIDDGADAEQLNLSSQVSVHGYPIITNIAPNKGPASGGTLVFVYCDGCQDRDKYLQIKVAFGDHIAKTTFDPEKNCYWAITPSLVISPNDPDLLTVPVYLVYTDPQKEVQELVWNPPGKQAYYQYRREGVQTAPVKSEPVPQWSARQIGDVAAKQKQRLEQYAHALKLNSKREAWLERLFEMEKDMNVLFTCLTQILDQKEHQTPVVKIDKSTEPNFDEIPPDEL